MARIFPLSKFARLPAKFEVKVVAKKQQKFFKMLNDNALIHSERCLQQPSCCLPCVIANKHLLPGGRVVVLALSILIAAFKSPTANGYQCTTGLLTPHFLDDKCGELGSQTYVMYQNFASTDITTTRITAFVDWGDSNGVLAAYTVDQPITNEGWLNVSHVYESEGAYAPTISIDFEYGGTTNKMYFSGILPGIEVDDAGCVITQDFSSTHSELSFTNFPSYSSVESKTPVLIVDDHICTVEKHTIAHSLRLSRKSLMAWMAGLAILAWTVANCFFIKKDRDTVAQEALDAHGYTEQQ
jgi:hypothetical protein